MTQVDNSKNPVLFDKFKNMQDITFTAATTVEYVPDYHEGKCTQAVAMQICAASDVSINSSAYTLKLYHHGMLLDTLQGSFNIAGTASYTANIVDLPENVAGAVNAAENYSLSITWNVTSSATPRISLLKYPDGADISARDEIPTHGFAITADNTAEFDKITNAIYVGTGEGNLEIVTEGGDTLIFSNVPTGSIIPIHAKQVKSDNTTVSNLLALYS